MHTDPSQRSKCTEGQCFLATLGCAVTVTATIGLTLAFDASNMVYHKCMSELHKSATNSSHREHCYKHSQDTLGISLSFLLVILPVVALSLSGALCLAKRFTRMKPARQEYQQL